MTQSMYVFAGTHSWVPGTQDFLKNVIRSHNLPYRWPLISLPSLLSPMHHLCSPIEVWGAL
jgi:hypothetical protein